MGKEEKCNVSDLLRKIILSELRTRPLIYCNLPSHRILLIARDCDVTEQKVNDYLILLKAKEPTGSFDYVGFVVERVDELCRNYGWYGSDFRVENLLNAIQNLFPEHSGEVLVSRQLLRQARISIP